MKNRFNSEYKLLLIAVIIGLIAGTLSILYASIIEYSFKNINHFFNSGTILKYIKILIPALGGAIVGLFLQYGSLTAKGHGVPAIHKLLLIERVLHQ